MSNDLTVDDVASQAATSTSQLMRALHAMQVGAANTSQAGSSTLYQNGPEMEVSVDLEGIIRSLSPAPSTSAARQSRTESTPYKRRNTRMKVFADEYFMTFDRISSDGQKKFWRCESKSTCPARIHTKGENLEVSTTLQKHNHEPPSPKILEFYQMGLEIAPRGVIIPIETVPPGLQKFKREYAMKKKEKNDRQQAGSSTNRDERDSVVAQSLSPALNLSPLSVSPSMPPVEAEYNRPVDRDAEAPQVDTKAEPMEINDIAHSIINQFQMAYNNETSSSVNRMAQMFRQPISNLSGVSGQISQMQRNLLIPKQEIAQPISLNSFYSLQASPLIANPDYRELLKKAGRIFAYHFENKREPKQESQFRIYVSKYEENDEDQDYQLLILDNRNEHHLRQALADFLGKPYPSQGLIISKSARMNVYVNEEVIAEWKNEQLFMLDARNAAKPWKLIPVFRN